MSLILNVKHLSGSLAGQSQRVALQEGRPLRLGRNSENDIKYNEEVDDLVSGLHAELSVEQGRLYIEDKRSSNGTFVNSAQCPAFEKIAVADGSRIRLASNGPEMQVTFEAAKATTAAAPPPPQESSLPAKQSVGRETLLREINRVKEEDRDLVAAEVARSKKSTNIWLAAGGVFLAVLVVVGAGAAYFFSTKKSEDAQQALQDGLDSVGDAVGKNVWADVEQTVSPSVAHVRCRYHIERPQLLEGDTSVTVQYRTVESTGSAVLIKPGLLLTAKHVVEPWKYAIDLSGTDFSNWEEFTRASGLKPVVELFEVQFPGLQPIVATPSATSETSDLALISIPEVNRQPVPLLTSNKEVGITDEVAIIGYPLNLGEQQLLTLDFSSAGSPVTRLTDMDPIFMKGTVSRALPETGEASHFFSLDASIEPGNSGGPVLNKAGSVIGIVVQRLAVGQPIVINGQTYQTYKEIRAEARAVSPTDMKTFLGRAGIL